MIAAASLYSIETEEALLGALMMDARALDRIEVALRPEHFYRNEHQRIYRAVRELADGSKTVDMLAVSDVLDQSGELPAVGGIAFLAELANCAMSSANAKRHAEIIVERAMLRALVAASDEIAGLASNAGLSVADKINAAQAKIMTLSDSATLGQREPKRIGDLLPDYLARLMARWELGGCGLSTGFPDLDKRLGGGLYDGGLYILAGRPAMGKTTFAMNIAENIAGDAHPVLVCSQEMPGEQLIDRAFASQARIELDKIRQGGLSEEEHDRLMATGGRMKGMPLFIDEQGALRIEDVRRKARQIKSRHGLRLVVVDYLQLMVGDAENRTQEISAISGGLKALAKELDCPVIALSQLNRGLEARPNKRPIMSDLRESGAIEQDADVILSTYRDEVYNEDTPHKGCAELGLLKNRMGAPGGFVPLAFLGHLCRFESMFLADWPQAPAPEQTPKKKRRFDD